MEPDKCSVMKGVGDIDKCWVNEGAVEETDASSLENVEEAETLDMVGESEAEEVVVVRSNS